MYCGNMSIIKFAKNLVFHDRSRHRGVCFYFLRDICKDKVIDMVYCRSGYQIAHIMSKTFKLLIFKKLRSSLALITMKEFHN
jgi:hypothetical protein